MARMEKRDVIVFVSGFVVGLAFLSLLIQQFSSLSIWENLILAAILSFLSSITYIIRKRIGYVESKSVDRDRIRSIFRLVTLLAIITAVSFYFVFDQVIESAKPVAPREKFDAEAVGILAFILLMTFYTSAPLLIAVIIAHSYGYGWKDLKRDAEARRRMGYVYTLYFFLLFLSVMCWVLVKSSEEYVITANKILLIIGGEILLALLFAAILAVILRLHGYGWGDIKQAHRIFSHNMASIEKPWWMLSKDSEEWRKANLVRGSILIAFVYLTLSFMLVWSVLSGRVEKFVSFFLMATVFLSIWIAVEFWGRAGRRLEGEDD